MTAARDALTAGVGFGWREALAGFTLDRADVGFVEVLAEHLPPRLRADGGGLPPMLELARHRGVGVVVHGLELSLGGAEPVDRRRVRRLARVAEAVGAPVVSEHAAFVRAGGREAGHLVPVPRTREGLAALVANVRRAQAELPVPLAVENPASVLRWPGAELSDSRFLSELVERTGCWLLLDVANLVADEHNHGTDVEAVIDGLPLERVAYVHVAGGVARAGLYHDTHRHRVPDRVWEVLAELGRRIPLPGVVLEWDGDFPPDEVLRGELDRIREVAAEPAQPSTPAAAPGPDRAELPPTWPSLAADQDQLLRALLGRGPTPTGFDPSRIAAAAAVLAGRHQHQHRHRRWVRRR